MEFKVLLLTSRKLVIELMDQGIYECEEEYAVYLDQSYYMSSKRIVQTIDGLKPDCDYHIWIQKGQERSKDILIHTPKEFVTLNVRDFGAKGDGLRDDTVSIQGAIQCCPKGGRVLIPAGVYSVSTLFLKSDIILEIMEGATLKGNVNPEDLPILPGLIESYDELSDYNLGTWEGNPLPTYGAILVGISVSNVIITGKGTIDGNATFDDWWKNPKQKREVFRPKLVFFNHCDGIVMEGIHCMNSPSWTIHPYFSTNLKFINLSINNHKDSPNTDGLNPESCTNVEIVGTYFSLGDDCIAIKSGKIYMGKKYKRPSQNIEIRQCFMEYGHGSVTIGSEMAGGVLDVTVKDSIFYKTDRGLRIKTRRGRGKDAIIDGIRFENIRMDEVLTPIVVNEFYFCDPDGHTEYVRTKQKLPIDYRTPVIGSLSFQNLECTNCHVAAAFFYGLPELKIKEVQMKQVNISFAPAPKKGVPAMMEGITEVSSMGLFLRNIEQVILEDVTLEGVEGDKILVEDVDHVVHR